MGRIAAIVALVAALIVAAVLIFGGGNSYTVTANFENASQLVKGNLVEVAGARAGTVQSIDLGPDNTALVELKIDGDYAPLPSETIATIRSQSLSGIANRYVQLTMPEGDEAGEPLDDGDTLPLSNTVSEVDLDQLFNTFDERTVGNFRKLIKGFARAYEGVGPQTNVGFKYLNPFLSTSRRVFGELTADERRFERLIVDGASLAGAVSERSGDLEQFIANTDQMMGALADENTALAGTIERLPGFMRNFNTTAVNLRATLDDLDPLVSASIPVAEKLQPFTAALRGFATDAVPTVRRLDAVVSRPGKDNDLIELTRLQPKLARITVGPVRRNGQRRPGSFPVSVRALRRSLPQLAFFRPYTVELVGWFNDFGTSGVYDANGGIGRISTTFNAFSVSPVTGIPNLFPGGDLTPEEISNGLTQDQMARCPGANERNPGDGSTPFTDNGTLDCDPSQVPPGP
ncbi:MAG TPA: MlaD family protein [Solirubrobacterales bacterium]|nr:MlaD family protein [Solirubrobacterales bacterium]